jgi:hypothetical protein
LLIESDVYYIQLRLGALALLVAHK